MQYETENIASLHELKTDLSLQYLVREAHATSEKQKAIILLHGVGSNEKDLFSFSRFLPDEFVVIAAQGPFELGLERYAWYEVDFATGEPVINSDQEAQSRQKLQDFIKQVKEKYKVDEVYLGGFSQGAIMSYSIGLTHPTEVTGILAFSGRILTQIRPSVHPNSALKHLKIFISHGLQDGTLPIHYARESKEYLDQLGVKLSYHEYEMGHQINNDALTEMIEWLKQ
jgi:phospholipase/carboxylesterase